jgi:hypothetical protein
MSCTVNWGPQSETILVGRNAVKAEDLSIVDVHDTFHVNIQGGGEDMDLFTVMVNVHHYCVIPSNLRQSHDQVDTYHLPWAFGYVVGLKR